MEKKGAEGGGRAEDREETDDEGVEEATREEEEGPRPESGEQFDTFMERFEVEE